MKWIVETSSKKKKRMIHQGNYDIIMNHGEIRSGFSVNFNITRIIRVGQSTHYTKITKTQKSRRKTNLLSTIEGVFGSEGHSQEVLVRIDEDVANRDDGGVLESERDRSNSLDGAQESINQNLLIDIEDVGSEDVAIVEDLDDAHPEGEGRDVQHVEESSFGRTDALTSSDNLDVSDDLNGTTSDLGGDTEGLEERGLARFHTSVSTRDSDIDSGEHACTSGGGDLVGGDDRSDFLKVLVGEDETDVATDVGEETLELGEFGENRAKSTSDHGVLAHQHNTLAAESDTNLMHLVGTDVVDIDNEDRS